MIARGLRNNNPGNLRLSGDRWKGIRPVQTDREFFQFISMPYGYRALLITLRNYRIRHGCMTVSDFIRRWAPPSENNTGSYIQRICNELQVPARFVPDINDRNQMCAFAAAISRIENGDPARMDDVYKGWDMI